MRRSVQFVTGNEGKYREVLEVVGHELEVGRVALDLVEVQGSADEVARDKCARAAAQLGGPVLTEDTCLSFDAMQGKLPGPYIKWFLDAVGTEGLCKMLDAFPTRGATAVCTFAYCEGPGHEPILFRGEVKGEIAAAPRSEGRGFGWDPIFCPEGSSKTFAQMTSDEKNAVSHRARALREFSEFVKNGMQRKKIKD